MTTCPQTEGGRMLKRGYSMDPECSRTTHRLRVGRSLLRTAIGCGEIDSWPEWVPGEMFDLAYRLADASQTARGKYHRAAAYAARAA